MTILILVWTFFKLGLFSFGGGYAMIPLMKAEILSHNWIPEREFADIVAISQMVPGALAVNSATYVGYRVAGVFGSAAATLGVFLPALILSVLVWSFLQKWKASLTVNSILTGIRPATVGLISAAVFFFARMSFFQPLLQWKGFALLPGEVLRLGFFDFRIPGLVIFAIILIETKVFKLKPIPAVMLSGILGLILM